MITSEEFALQLAAAIDTIRPRLEVGLNKVGEVAKKAAVDAIGHEHGTWPPLKPETIARKANGNTPLLETGEMRASIRHQVDPLLLEVVVGSNNKKALFHEIGTSRISPRPFLSLGMKEALPVAEATLGKIAVSILTLER